MLRYYLHVLVCVYKSPFQFAPAELEHSPLCSLLRKVTRGTMSRAWLVSEGSPRQGLAIIESGLLLPTEDGVSKLSWIVYRVINSLHTNTCQLRLALTKTVHLIPPAVHLQPTSNCQSSAPSRRSDLDLCAPPACWMLLKVVIGVIKILTQLALHD